MEVECNYLLWNGATWANTPVLVPGIKCPGSLLRHFPQHSTPSTVLGLGSVLIQSDRTEWPGPLVAVACMFLGGLLAQLHPNLILLS